MQYEKQPVFNEIKVSCGCGNQFVMQSTLKDDLNVEICSACHPFYTGTQRVVDTAGRVDAFKKRYAKKAKKAKEE